MWFVRLGRSFPFAFVFFSVKRIGGDGGGSFRDKRIYLETTLSQQSYASFSRFSLCFPLQKKLFQKALLLLLLATVQSLNLVLRPHFFRLLFWNANLEIKDFLWHGTIWKTYKNEIKRLVYKVFSSIFFNFLLKTNRSTLPERLSFFSSINVLFVLQFNFTAFFGPHPECPPPLFCLFC